MRNLSINQVIILVFVVLLVGLGLFVFVGFNNKENSDSAPVELTEPEDTLFLHEVIGKSVEGRDIEVYTYGDGNAHLLFVGGIHGGYEWNSVLLSYKFIDYLNENLEIVPDNLMVSVIPSANPDGVYKIIGKEGRFLIEDALEKEATEPGRFNAHGVDLNRNFDCKWKPESMWKGNVVDAGSKPFSEPEAITIRDFVLENKLDAAIFWHSKSNAVYASECEEGVLLETIDIMNEYSRASGYKAVESFDYYEVTGDAEGWLASINIPAITVELKNHNEVEWERNLSGINAIFEYYKGENIE